MYGPDFLSSDEEGFSDDNDYYEFKEKLKATQIEADSVVSEAEKEKQRLKSIFSAIAYGREDVVFEHLDKGLPVDTDLDLGWTPLLLSSTTANINIISKLIKNGANVHQTREETTPLMFLCNIAASDEATEQNILTCVKLLLDNKVDVNVCDNKRRTAIMFAANNGHLETVKLLLPLVEKNAEDNQRWNVLFYAVDGNQSKIVELLLNEGFSCDNTDIRENTPADIAHHNGFEQILELFPKDPFDELYIHLNNNELNFEETFNQLKQNEMPWFFNDICKILYGTRSEQILPILREKKVNLYEFLSLTDFKLEEMGVKFPYQRSRITRGLYKLHKHPFKPQSIPFIKKDQMYTNIDVAAAVLTCVKQLTAMEASLKFIVENSKHKLSLPESKEVNILISKTRQQINRLKGVSEQLVKKTEQWDLMIKPADRITRKRWNIPWCNLWASMGALSVSVFLLYRFKFHKMC